MANFPGALPSIPTSTTNDHLNDMATLGHVALHNLIAGEVLAVATKMGTGASTPTNGTFLAGNGTGSSAWRSLVKSDAGLGNVDNTADTDKPVSTAQTAALALKAPLAHDHSNAANGGRITSSGMSSFDTSLTTISNPYKFHVTRTGAANIGNAAFAVLAFDTKVFDTNNNVSSGVYTVPVNGFYQFDARIGTAAAYTILIIALFKNGSETLRGDDLRASVTAGGVSVSGMLQLAVGDTIDIRGFGNSAYAIDVGITAINHFSGFLVSHT